MCLNISSFDHKGRLKWLNVYLKNKKEKEEVKDTYHYHYSIIFIVSEASQLVCALQVSLIRDQLNLCLNLSGSGFHLCYML